MSDALNRLDPIMLNEVLKLTDRLLAPAFDRIRDQLLTLGVERRKADELVSELRIRVLRTGA